MACPVLSPDSAFLSSMLGYVDCQAQAIGQSGYQALMAPGSNMAILLAASLTIFVALFGYRMLFGETPGAREGVMAVVKLGIVLVLATSWPAFRTLVYDVALHGPAELATGIGQPAGLPGAGGGLVTRLQLVDNQLVELLVLGTGKPPDADVILGPTQPLTPQQQQQQMQKLQQLQQKPRWDPARDAALLGNARTLYLTSAIAAFSSVRLVAGLLLAMGPLFALFLLFDGTRGLFEGWIRGLGGAALGALSTTIILGVELALMEPWLAEILAERRADIATPSVPVELLVVTLVFTLTLLAALVATARVAYGFHLPVAWRTAPARLVEAFGGRQVQPAGLAGEDRMATGDQRSRAFAVADAVAASQRREAASPPPPATHLGGSAATHSVSRDIAVPAAVPLGQSFRRRTRGRVSAGAQQRDVGRRDRGA